MKKHTKISCAAVALISAATGAYSEQQQQTFREKMAGFEFGAGVPLMTPLTGYNVFVGYVNKNASTFLGRRFGIRADFTIPSNLRLSGTVSDNNKNGYDVDFHGKVMGFDIKLSDFSDKKIEIDAIKDHRHQPISIGQDALDVTLELHNQNMGLIVDFYPFGNTWFWGGIRFSGGYYVGDFSISANANVNNDIKYSYRAGNRNYLYAQVAKGSQIGVDYKWKYHGPYAGIGFDLGIWRGFKFFMDAGVVFARPPKVSYANVHDDNLNLQARLDIYDKDGRLYSLGNQDMVNILPNGISKAPTVAEIEQIVGDTVGVAVHEAVIRYPDAYKHVLDVIPEFKNVDPKDLGKDIINFVNNNDPAVPDAPWIDALLTKTGDYVAEKDTYSGTALTEAVAEIKQKWSEKDSIQNDINDAWAEYDKEKQKAIKETNDFLDDLGVMPMVKIGFMYRF